MSTFDESGVRRDAGGQFAEQGRSAPVDLPAKPTIPSLYLTIQPQYWRGDYAVDAGDPEEFDIGPLLAGKDAETRETWLNAIRDGESWLMDEIYTEAAEAGLVTEGLGPFHVYAANDDADHWEENAPAPWAPDGVTPHPTGGYVSVRQLGNGTAFVDADGELHREDGPAFEDSDGSSYAYYRHGRPHRMDGAAIRRCVRHGNGSSEVEDSWYVEGELVGAQQTTIEAGWQIVNGVPRRTD
jgi:hypothetical protein